MPQLGATRCTCPQHLPLATVPGEGSPRLWGLLSWLVGIVRGWSHIKVIVEDVGLYLA